MAPEHETFFSLLSDASHWEFEGFIQIVVDGLLIGTFWRLFLRPKWQRWTSHHSSDDKKIEVLERDFSRSSASVSELEQKVKVLEEQIHGLIIFSAECSASQKKDGSK